MGLSIKVAIVSNFIRQPRGLLRQGEEYRGVRIFARPYRGRAVATMNNTAWQRARREAGSQPVRIHDLRATFACRLRAVGVSMEDREVLLGHANHSMAGHYASADIGRLLREANRVLDRQETRTVLRVANG